jgi:hypothetical protein
VDANNVLQELMLQRLLLKYVPVVLLDLLLPTMVLIPVSSAQKANTLLVQPNVLLVLLVNSPRILDLPLVRNALLVLLVTLVLLVVEVVLLVSTLILKRLVFVTHVLLVIL